MTPPGVANLVSLLHHPPSLVSSPQLCLGPLNEPTDIILCNKSTVLLRALEKEGAAPGSILMVDIQPPEEPGVLFYHGAAQDVLYKRPWRRLYVGAPCTHTANSGAASRAGKHLVGLVLAAIAFCVWCYCAPAQAVWFEHSRSCLGDYWMAPSQVVSPDAFGDTFQHPTTGATCGLQKATEVRMRGYSSLQMPIDAAAQAPNPVSYASAVIATRHPDGSRLSRAEVAELRARYAPRFMRAVAIHTRPENIVHQPHVPYGEAMAVVLANYAAKHGARATPRGWSFEEGRGPPHSVAARELDTALRAHGAGRHSTYALPGETAAAPPAGAAGAPQPTPPATSVGGGPATEFIRYAPCDECGQGRRDPACDNDRPPAVRGIAPEEDRPATGGRTPARATTSTRTFCPRRRRRQSTAVRRPCRHLRRRPQASPPPLLSRPPRRPLHGRADGCCTRRSVAAWICPRACPSFDALARPFGATRSRCGATRMHATESVTPSSTGGPTPSPL